MRPLFRPVIKIKDLEFEPFIGAAAIQQKVFELAQRINSDYRDRTPLFLPILNGSFIFAADLIRRIEIPCRVSFVKYSSYSGTQSSGKLTTLIGLQESLFGQDVILVEDIMDSGLTLTKVVEELEGLGTKSVAVVSLIRKAPAREEAVQPKYIGFELNDEFVVGYGLDYEGYGRNINDLLRLVTPAKN